MGEDNLNGSTGNLVEDGINKVSTFRESLVYCSNCGEKAGYFDLYDKICTKCRTTASAPSLLKQIYLKNKKSTFFLILLVLVLVLNLVFLGDLKHLNTPGSELSEEQKQFAKATIVSLLNVIVIFLPFLLRHVIFKRRAGVLLSLAIAAILLMLLSIVDLIVSGTTTNPLYDSQLGNLISVLMAIVAYKILRSENYKIKKEE